MRIIAEHVGMHVVQDKPAQEVLAHVQAQSAEVYADQVQESAADSSGLQEGIAAMPMIVTQEVYQHAAEYLEMNVENFSMLAPLMYVKLLFHIEPTRLALIKDSNAQPQDPLVDLHQLAMHGFIKILVQDHHVLALQHGLLIQLTTHHVMD